jgi:hypothetical protein
MITPSSHFLDEYTHKEKIFSVGYVAAEGADTPDIKSEAEDTE